MIYSERKFSRLLVAAALPRVAGVLIAGTAFALPTGCSTSKQAQSSEVHAPAQEQNYNAPAYRGALAPDDGQWTRPAKDLASTRYTTLNQVTPENAQNLKVAFTFSLGTTRGAEAAPIVVNNTMYIVTPWPNYVYALDLTKPGGPLKWKFDPETSPASKGAACCDWVNRGGVYTDGEFIFNTLDGSTIALNADTGKPIWRNHVADIQRGETLTMAPLVVKDKVMVGNSGGEFGIRGWVKALDSKTGKLDWTGYTTGPDKDVLIGPRFHAFYQKDQGADLGVKTWPPDAWRHSGGGMWGWMSYDPETNLLFHGTANPSPWNSEERPGDNKWTAGIFARDADTGEAVWAYQYNPHDLYDYDGVNENVLLDLPINGQQRKVLVHPDRNGYMYVMDRKTGEVLSAHAFGNITDSTGVDLKTGDIHYVPAKHPQFGSVVRDICPAAPGAKDWTPMAFSPRTGLLYIPHNNLCMDVEDISVDYIQGTPYVGANVKMHAGAGGNAGFFTAFDPVQGKIVWQTPDEFPVWSGAVATGGDVVFYGTLEGWFRAVDAHTGKQLWQFKTGSGIIGQPIVYRGPDGKEYVAILSGVGGWAGAIVDGQLDSRDPTAALGFVGAMTNLPNKTTAGGTLYVFSL